MPQDDFRAEFDIALRACGVSVVPRREDGDEAWRAVLTFAASAQQGLFRHGLARHVPLAVAHVAAATGVERERVRAYLNASDVSFGGESLPATRLLGTAYARADGSIVSSETVRLALVVALWRDSGPDGTVCMGSPTLTRLREALAREGLRLAPAEVRAHLAWLGVGVDAPADVRAAAVRLAPCAWLRDPLLAALVAPAVPRHARSA
jgi:hypothetical protein